VVEPEDTPIMVSKVVDLSKPEEVTVNMSKFSSVRAKDLKDVCKTLGFSPKGTKLELIIRLLKHPSFNSEEDIVASITTSKKKDDDENVEEAVDVNVDGDDDTSKEVIIS
jgi:hypothetical protein